MSRWVIKLIGTTFLSTDAELVGEKSIVAIAVSTSGVVVGVDRASNTVAVADEVVIWAYLAKTAHQAKTAEAYTSVCSGRVS